MFESATPGDRLVLSANPNYWGDKPKVAHLVVAFVTDENVRPSDPGGRVRRRRTAAEAGRVVQVQHGLKVHAVTTGDYRGVMLPMGNPVTGDVAIRQALSLAVDSAALVKGVLASAGDPAFGPVAPSSQFADPTSYGKPTADAAAATSTLDAAGWTVGASGVREKNGQQASFTLMYPASDSLRKELALSVASYAKAVGVDVKPEGLTWDAIEPRMKNDALIMGWGTPYDPDFITYKLFRVELRRRRLLQPRLLQLAGGRRRPRGRPYERRSGGPPDRLHEPPEATGGRPAVGVPDLPAPRLRGQGRRQRCRRPDRAPRARHGQLDLVERGHVVHGELTAAPTSTSVPDATPGPVVPGESSESPVAVPAPRRRRLVGVGRLVRRRVLVTIPVLIAVTLGMFAIGNASPIDPVRQYAGAAAFTATPENLDQIRHNWGLDDPAPVQYLRWLGHMVRGDLGFSTTLHQPVTKVLASGPAGPSWWSVSPSPSCWS